MASSSGCPCRAWLSFGDPGGPQRLAAGQGGGSLVFVRGRLRRLRKAGVLNMRRVDGEDHHDLAAQFLGDTGSDAYRAAADVAEGGVLEVRGADAQDDALAEVVCQPASYRARRAVSGLKV